MVSLIAGAKPPQAIAVRGDVSAWNTAMAAEEMGFILAHKWRQLGLTFAPDDFTDGNFRLIQRVFAQIARILVINGLRTITREVVEAAREQLVIGPH